MNTLKENLKRNCRQFNSFARWVLILLLIIYLFSGTASISSNQVGVLQRFGKVIKPELKPGIYFNLPWPIDKLNKIAVKKISHIFIDDFYHSSEEPDIPVLSANEFCKRTGLVPCCITGDNNLVTINCVIQYKITNPVDYLFKMARNEKMLRYISGSTMIHCLSTLSIDKILTYGKGEIENYLKINIQNRLDKIGCGLGINFIELKNINPPSRVQEYFNDVINAQIDKKKTINEMESYRNECIPQAYAEAEKIHQEALSYKIEKIKASQGETERFLKQLEEYSKAKEITKKRLHLEFLKAIFPKINKKYLLEKNSEISSPTLKLMSRE